jgi:16S rRNA (guanine527-N7)-methyltransferase
MSAEVSETHLYSAAAASTHTMSQASGVKSSEFLTRLTGRLQSAGIVLSSEMLASLEAYFSILTRWNARMNLTAFPVENPTDETLDRLLVEPLAAVQQIPNDGSLWFDVGSGGGSPAIPLKIACPSLRLVMTESKARKAAFLREVVRSLGLADATVENVRFEDVGAGSGQSGTADLVTVRAVRIDETLFEAAAKMLRPRGRLMMFRPSRVGVQISGFELANTVRLLDWSQTSLLVFNRMFHVEQND